jgi:hypothetical protein
VIADIAVIAGIGKAKPSPPGAAVHPSKPKPGLPGTPAVPHGHGTTLRQSGMPWDVWGGGGGIAVIADIAGIGKSKPNH